MSVLSTVRDEISDHELIEEMRRRELWTPTPDALTDAQLRAECERRWPPGLEDPRWTQLKAERDEWKRRAEEAEAHLEDPKRVIRIVDDSGSLVPLGSLHRCGRLDLLVTRRDNERLPMVDLFLSGAEAGKGIAAVRLDTAVAFLPEDLLCEDA